MWGRVWCKRGSHREERVWRKDGRVVNVEERLVWRRGVVRLEEGCGVGEWSVWRRVVG